MINAVIHWRNKFQQRFGKVSGDPVMFQRRPQRFRVTAFCQLAICLYTQRFTLDATANTFKSIGDALPARRAL
ncbi:Uncharacterised protein [Pantoea agglomerans]|uniref:Transposase n=1 Tax=Enterobacter agglomerans TaxID=549 RepID=A0A379ABU6_ENTAG|nr:Uncharacterised protein [Pantoea agglomerans]